MMGKNNFSEVFLKKPILSHTGIEFIDIVLDEDSRLFIDPILIDFYKEEKYINNMHKRINSFFEEVKSTLLLKDDKKLFELCSNCQEVYETRLGYSRNAYLGKGKTQQGFIDVLRKMEVRYLFEIGKIQSFEEIYLQVGDFGSDNLSDLISNIIRKDLNEFTIDVCEKYGIELNKFGNIGKYWSITNKKWIDYSDKYLEYDGKRVFLVPKIICINKHKYSPKDFMSKVIFPIRQEYHLTEKTSLAGKYKDGSLRRPSKKDIYNEEVKDRLSVKKYIERHSNIDDIIRYRQMVSKQIKSGEYEMPVETLDKIIYRYRQ